tara:strand:- start:14823 stop:15401 length:579 start_codon:yes stop_codon:yes gene_type:complete
MSNEITLSTPMGTLWLPKFVQIEGELKYEVGNLTKVTRNRVLTAVSTGIVHSRTGDAYSVTNALSTMYKLPLVTVTDKTNAPRVLLSLMTQDKIVEIEAGILLFVAANSKHKPYTYEGKLDGQPSDTAWWKELILPRNTSAAGMLPVIESCLMDVHTEEMKSTRAKLAARVERGATFFYSPSTGEVRVKENT